MTYYDAQLQQLQQQIARLNHLNTVIPELRNQRSTLESRVRELKSVMLREQEDVERLEGGSLAAFFYNVIGKMDEHLTKERQEAQVKGLIGKTSFDYVDEMIEAKLDGNLSRYVNTFHEFEHYYHYTPNGWIERARGMDFWDTIGKMDNKLSMLYLRGY